MELIWLGLFFLILVISFLLATRSMKNFQEIPLKHLEYSLYLIQSSEYLNPDIIKRIHNLALMLESVISFEKLSKGQQTVTAIYAPRQFEREFPELNLLELEDYISIEPDPTGRKIVKDTTLPWVIAPKNSKKEVASEGSFFEQITLSDMQHFFWQIVVSPIKQSNDFQVTIRAMVSEKDPATRVELAKKIDSLINHTTGLIKESRQQSSGIIFDSFAKRTIIPKEVMKFELNAKEILKLLS